LTLPLPLRHQPHNTAVFDRNTARWWDPRVTAVASAGIVGPVLFTVLVIVQGLLQPDYSHLAMPISALAAWPYGWIQNLNFYMSGALMTAFAIGLQAELRSRGGGRLDAALLIVSGIGIVLAGLTPMTTDSTGAIRESVGHVVSAFMAFLGAGIGLIIVSRRLRKDPNWRNLSAYSLTCGIAIVVLFVLLGNAAMPDDSPLHPWAGLLQRIVLAVWFPCIVVLATRLLRVTKGRSDQVNGRTHAAIA
jgi:hypothetical membrane protein